jgi:hypothetical protein
MIIGVILVYLFAVVLFVAAVGVVFKSGEKESICKYGYSDEDGEQ